MGFLNLILKREENPIVSIVYKNPFNIREISTEKEAILDIKAETQREEILDIEMQILYDPEYIERTIHYHGGMIIQGLAAGEAYGKLKKTISIHLLDYIQFQDSPKYHNCFRLLEQDEGFPLTSLVEMHYIELPKVNPGKRKNPQELTKAERFLEFVRYAGEDDSESYLDILKRADEGKEIKMAEKIMEKVTEEELVRERALARDKYLHQQASIARSMKRLKEMDNLEAKLEDTEARLESAKTKLEHTATKLEHATTELEHTTAELQHTETKLEHTEAELQHTEAELQHTEAELEHTEAKLEDSQQNYKILIHALRAKGMTKEHLIEMTGLSMQKIEEYLK